MACIYDTKLLLSSRDCYTRNEGQLEFHNIYTYASCQFECKIKESRIEQLNNFNFNSSFQRAKEDAGCIPWYLPQTPSKDNVICDPWKTKQFLKTIEAF